MGNYGICYKGSKNKIVDKIFLLFPRASNFYDLFAGGCSVTHYALTQNKYKFIYCNDINPSITDLFKDAIKGKYKNESRWISREDFFKLKDSDPYIYYLWSFGNKGDTYLYGEDIEPYKKAVHYAIFFDDLEQLKALFPSADFTFLQNIKTPNARRLELQRYFKASGVAINTPFQTSADAASILQNYTRLQNLERLESINKLNSLRLENLERLSVTNKSYNEIDIKPDSVIYCDIPYYGTDGYGQEFDFEAFYKWAENQSQPLFISSYEMPRSKFICISEIAHRCTLSADKDSSSVTERVFIPRHQEALYKRLQPQPSLFNDLF